MRELELTAAEAAAVKIQPAHSKTAAMAECRPSGPTRALLQRMVPVVVAAAPVVLLLLTLAMRAKAQIMVVVVTTFQPTFTGGCHYLFLFTQ